MNIKQSNTNKLRLFYKIINHWLFHFLIIAASIFLVYSNTLNNKLVWDDETFLVNWTETKSFAYWPYWLKGVVPEGHEGVYRPVRTFFYATSYALWDKNFTLYHLQSIFLHLSISIIVYCIAHLLFHKRSISLITGLIFALHPVQTESVTFLTASFDLFGHFFFFLSYLLYILSKTKIPRARIFFVITTYISTLIAFLSNEFSLTLPIIYLLHDYVFNSPLRKLDNYPNSLKKLTLYFPYTLLTIIYLIVRFLVLHINTRSLPDSISLLKKLYLMAIVVFNSSITIIYPRILTVSNIRPNLNAVLSIHGTILFLDIIALIGLFIPLLIITFILSSIYHRRTAILFCLTWIVIYLFLIIYIYIVTRIFAERYLYLPMFGFALCLALLFNRLLNFFRQAVFRLSFIIIITALMTGYAWRSYTRNNDWKDAVTLWSNTLSVSPNDGLIMNNLGIAYYNEKQFDKAIQVFKDAIKLVPSNSKAYVNLANSYYFQKNYTDAENTFQKAINIDPDSQIAYKNLAYLNVINKNTDKAITLLKEAILRFPTDPEVRYRYATLVLRQGKTDEAIKQLESILIFKPTFTPALNNLAAIYLSQKNSSEALTLLQNAYKFNRFDPDILFNLGSAYLALNKRQESEEAFRQAYNLNPKFTLAKDKLNLLLAH